VLFSNFAEVEALCRNQIPEALQLEFKEKASPERAQLDNGDKKTIAKAVSALANSGGGTLVFGVRTRRVGEVDVAFEVRPIAEPDICRVQVEYVCKTNVSPEIQGLIVDALVGPEGQGVIVCVIPSSDRRPHMSTAPGVHTYYRRTFQGNVPMTPFEVEEQVLAVREAVLQPIIRPAAGATFSNIETWIAVGFGVQFSLENVGTRACINPFIRVRATEPTQSHSAIFDARLNVWKSDTGLRAIVHVDDAIDYFTLSFIARVFPDLLTKVTNANDLLSSIRLYGGAYELNSPTVTDKKEIEALAFEVTHGAENAVVRTSKFEFNRDEIVANILVKLGDSIRDMVIGYVGVWRSDLIAELRTRFSI
jgi:hypothetical protein